MAQLIASTDNPCGELENGNILFFKEIPFEFPQEEINFLLMQKQGSAGGRKNIAYKPQIDRVTNHQSGNPAERERLHQILRNYSQRVTSFLSTFLAPYAARWSHDYASFRPFQEKGRKLRLRARNDLLHVDAFPTRPTDGARILRFFTNINPTEPRIWNTSTPFSELVDQFLGTKGFPVLRSYSHFPFARFFRTLLRIRSPYDAFMLRMHHFMKENEQFQKECPKDRWEFPPLSCWAVFTDQVSHAALAGQYALEQTFLIPRSALLSPELSPIGILERIAKATLTSEHPLNG